MTNYKKGAHLNQVNNMLKGFVFALTTLQVLLAGTPIQEPATYTTLAKLYRPSLIVSTATTKSLDLEQQKDDLSPTELTELGFALLAEKQEGPQDPIATTIVYKDLEIYLGRNKASRSLLSKIDNSTTILGKIVLAKMLFSPTTNIEELRKRQAIIKALVEQPELTTTLEQHLATIKKNEPALLWFWKKLSEEIQATIDQFYFSNEHLTPYNTSETMLNYLTISNTIGAPIYQRTWQFLNDFINAVIKSYVRYNDINGNYLYNHFVGKLNPISWMQDIKDENPRFDNKWIEAILYLFWFQKKYQEVAGLLSSIREAKAHLNQFKAIHQKMHNLAQYIEGAKSITTMLQQNNAIAPIMPELQTLNAFFAEPLATNLASKPFTQSPSLLNNNGKILATFKMMQESKTSITDFFEAIGYLDAYLSIAKLYLDAQKNQRLPYTFAMYADAPTPCIVLEHYWTPFISSDNLVTNSVELGTPGNARNLIITGPNAAGKSTNLKTIALCLLLAQTIGIVPAQQAVITPFAKISTYLNLYDTTGKESLFQAEIHRAQMLINELKNLPPHEFAFIIFDEIFTATNSEEGIACAYGVAKKIARYDNCCSIIATHFAKLTQLENDTHGLFKNYCVSAEKQADGSFVYPYKLVPGINMQAIALDLLKQEGFDNDIIEEAKQVLATAPV